MFNITNAEDLLMALFEPWHFTFRDAGIVEHCFEGLMDLCKWGSVQWAPLPAWYRDKKKKIILLQGSIVLTL